MKVFLRGESNQVALTNTNHNGKNIRCQLVGNSSVSSISKFAFDPGLLNMASQLPKNVVKNPPSKETICFIDWASDLLVIGMASPNTVEALLQLKSRDEGNVLVSQMK